MRWMTAGPLFDDRRDAGRKLAERVRGHADAHAIVLGLARGGVPVAYEIARAIGCPLDVMVVRKIGAPHQPELAVGALAGSTIYLNDRIVAMVGLSTAQLDALVQEKKQELLERSTALRGDRAPPNLRGKTVVLVDDGVATGATMFASIEAARDGGAARVVVAVPVCAADTLDELQERADEVVALRSPADFFAVGQWYREFGQTGTEEVRALLDLAAKWAAGNGERGAT